MARWKELLLPIFYLILVLAFSELVYYVSTTSTHEPPNHIILDSKEYRDDTGYTVLEQLWHREIVQPFNIVSFIIFALAICHIFLAHRFHLLSENLREKNRKMGLEYTDTFMVEFLGFMGEVEVIFGIWVIPLMIAMSLFYDWNTAVHYLNEIDYMEPLFVVVIMTLASTRPILHLSETLLKGAALLGGKTVKAWWFSILTFGPLLGSFITEPAAMTISALLLARQFYQYEPSKKFAYATLGLLFVNISVGGVLTNFAAPPVLMVVQAWNWNTYYMMTTFGIKAIAGILLSNLCYFWFFKKELDELEIKKIKHLDKHPEEEERPIPFGIAFIHIMFLAWVVVHLHYPVVFIGTFLLFLGFHQATRPYQDILLLRPSVMVGFFLAGLIVHGNLQGWWVSALLTHVSEESVMLLSIVLTAFNDDAQVTFLATLIPSFSEGMKYAVVAGAVAGGGLTVIANAPNLAGQSLLQRYFHAGISSLYLFYGALIPTIILALSFYLGKIL